MPPCDSIILNRVDLKLADKGLIKKALEKLGVLNLRESGGTFTFRYKDADYVLGAGKLTSRSSRYESRDIGQVADVIKQSYSRCAVEQAAESMGWYVEQNADDPNSYVITKS